MWRTSFPVKGSDELKNSLTLAKNTEKLKQNAEDFAKNFANGGNVHSQNLFDNQSKSKINANNDFFEKNNMQNTATNSKNLGNTILNELNSIKSEIAEKKSNFLKTQENDIFSNSKIDDGLIVLSELLKTLRENKDFAVLMTCRKIKSIEVKNGLAVIDYDEDSVKDLVSNEKYYSVMQEFFNSKNLSFKLKEKIERENDREILNKLLGGKLKIGFINQDKI